MAASATALGLPAVFGLKRNVQSTAVMRLHSGRTIRVKQNMRYSSTSLSDLCSTKSCAMTSPTALSTPEVHDLVNICRSSAAALSARAQPCCSAFPVIYPEHRVTKLAGTVDSSCKPCRASGQMFRDGNTSDLPTGFWSSSLRYQAQLRSHRGFDWLLAELLRGSTSRGPLLVI